MTKRELVTHISAETGLTLARSAEVLDVMIEGIKQALCNGDRVLISNFGAFELHSRGACMLHNPKTGDDIVLESRDVPFFRVSKSFKTLIESERRN